MHTNTDQMVMRRLINLLCETMMPTSLDQIVAFATRLGVDLEVWEDDERIDLHWIERRGGQPGAGAEVMQQLCAYADHTRRFILLQVANDSLAAYYAQWNFDELDADEMEDYFPDWDDILIRRPIPG